MTRIVDADAATLDRALEELVKGPMTNGLENALPGGIRYTGSQRKDGVTYLNFTEEFAELAEDPAAKDRALRCILLTAAEYDDEAKVCITVNGQIWDEEVTVPTFAILS